eukprot:10730515-Alexandrium_andersonii.AAC.1
MECPDSGPTREFRRSSVAWPMPATKVAATPRKNLRDPSAPWPMPTTKVAAAKRRKPRQWP